MLIFVVSLRYNFVNNQRLMRLNILKKEERDFCVLKARYPNNPALSDEGAQCGVAAAPAKAAC